MDSAIRSSKESTKKNTTEIYMDIVVFTIRIVKLFMLADNVKNRILI